MNNYKQVFEKYFKNTKITHSPSTIKSPDEAYNLLMSLENWVIFLQEDKEKSRDEYSSKIAELASENADLHRLLAESLSKYEGRNLEALHWYRMYEDEKKKFKLLKKIFRR